MAQELNDLIEDSDKSLDSFESIEINKFIGTFITQLIGVKQIETETEESLKIDDELLETKTVMNRDQLIQVSTQGFPKMSQKYISQFKLDPETISQEIKEGETDQNLRQITMTLPKTSQSKTQI